MTTARPSDATYRSIEVRRSQVVSSSLSPCSDRDPAEWTATAPLARVEHVGLPVPDDAERERVLARQWRLAQVNLALAVSLLVLALLWWSADDATWQPWFFTVLGVLIVVAAVSNVRQQQRNRRKRQEEEPR